MTDNCSGQEVETQLPEIQ